MNTFLPWSQGRLIAVDHGTRRVKLLLAAAHGAGVRVLDQKIVDLQEEGLLTPEEIHRHLAELIQAWGDWPLALTLPAPLTFSQVLDLPAAGEADLPKIIAEQTDRLRGVSPSPLVYEAVPLEPHGAYQRPYYITLAREDDVNQHLHRVTDTVNEVRDVSPVAGALVAAYGAVNPVGQNCILVDIGDTITVVAVVRRQRPVFASSFGSGVAGWIQEAARAAKCPSGEMETRLGVQDLFTGADALPALTAATEEWLTELRKLLDNWQRANPNEPAPAKMPILVSGGALQLRGLLEFLRTRGGFPFQTWPAPPHVRSTWPISDFVVAYGTAVAAFHRPPNPPSLLPPPLRAHRRRLRKAARLNLVCSIGLFVVALLIGLATWHKTTLLEGKRQLEQEALAALAQVEQLTIAGQDRDRALEQYWPLFDRQERTLDLLHTLRVVQQARVNHDFWCVLLADQDCYARGTTLPIVVTNRFGLTNTVMPSDDGLVKPTFVVELCVPAQGEQALKVVSEVVAELKQDPLFSRVDSVPSLQRRAWVDAKVLIPDRHFALTVELADLEWRALFQNAELPETRTGTTNAPRRPFFGPPARPRTNPPVSPPAAAKSDA